MRTKQQAIPYRPRRTKNERAARAAQFILAAVMVTMGLLLWMLP